MAMATNGRATRDALRPIPRAATNREACRNPVERQTLSPAERKLSMIRYRHRKLRSFVAMLWRFERALDWPWTIAAALLELALFVAFFDLFRRLILP